MFDLKISKFDTIKKSLNKGLENKIMELKRKLDTKTDELKVAEEKVARAAESGALTGRVKYFSNIEELVFAITFKILRILMEDIEIKSSLDFKLQTVSICSVRILNILEVTV